MGEIVPELHDVLKLTRLVHDICKWSSEDHETFKEFLPVNTQTWKGVLQHHLRFEIYPSEPDTILLCIADDLAASLSRAGEMGPVEHGLKKLWKPMEKVIDVKLHENKDIILLFKFLSTDPSWEEFLKKYEYILKNRPEDEHQGRNITSLYTHCKLTGQFYRLLRTCPAFSISPEDVGNKTKEEIIALIKQKEREWQLTIADCKFRFFQNPFKVRDLNVFITLEELTQRIATCYSDNVLFRTSGEVLLILPDESMLEDISAKAYQKRFWIEIVNKRRRPLEDLYVALQKPSAGGNIYDLLPELFPICDLCQAAEATKHWPEDYVLGHRELCPKCRELLSQNPLSSVIDLLCEADKAKLEDIIEEPLREDLCENCFSLRVEGVKLRKLDKWTKEGQAKVAWLKLSLDFKQLIDTLRDVHLKKTEIRFSVVSEFQEDYSHFLQEFNSRIENSFRIENVEKVMSDFFCIKIGSFKESLKILQVYYELLRNFFPAFLNLENSPLKIAMVCANPKFPFFEVWRILEGAEKDIFVSLQGGRTMRAPIKALRLLIEAADRQYRKSALYKLTRIEETSGTLAELTFQNRRDEDSRTYSTLARTLRPELGPKLDFSSIFTFARLMGD